MQIKIATHHDLVAIAKIYNQAVAAGQKTADLTSVMPADLNDWFDSHTPDKYPIFVAKDDAEVVGYLSISPYRPGRMALQHTAEVSYYIHFEHHQKGVASHLLKHAIERCPSLQIKNLFAILIDSNEGSIRLLEKYGFEKWGHLPRVAEFDGVEYGQFYYGLRVAI